MNYNVIYPYEVKPLSYDVNSLEAYLDKTTVCIHHDKIYVKYVTKLNLLIKNSNGLDKYSIEELLYNPYLIPANIIDEVKYNAGGIYNHELYFNNLTNKKNSPKENFRTMINNNFDSFDNLKEQILKLAMSPYNYHWIIVCMCHKGNLKLVGLKDNDTTIPLNLCSLLVIDIAEHAYFIKYHNHKEHYVKTLFEYIDYDVVEERLNNCLKYIN